MAYKLIEIRVNPLTNMEHREFICDTDADFESLPKAHAGDAAVSAETGNVYVVNASGEWVEFGGGRKDAVGTWVFNDELTQIDKPFAEGIEFVECSGYMLDNERNANFDISKIGFFGDTETLEEMSIISPDEDENSIYFAGEGFASGFDHKTITITKQPDDETFIAWLKANATKA